MISIARNDCFLEIEDSTDGSGTYTTDWIDSTGITGFCAYQNIPGFSPGVTMEGSIDGSTGLGNPETVIQGGSSSPTDLSSKEILVPFRYFRLKITGATASTAFKLFARVVR